MPPLRSRLRSFGLAAAAIVTQLAAAPAPDADNGGLSLPPGFRAQLVADQLMAGRKTGNASDNLRFLAVAPNGDLYAKTSRGGILALRDTDGDGRFDEKREFGSGGGTGIAVRDGWLYHSSNDAVFRYRLAPGELVPRGEPETIVRDLPNRRQHEAKSFTFDGDGRLLVEIGSPSNAHGNPDRAYMKPGTPSADPTEFLSKHGGFWRFDPAKSNQTPADGFHFSTGHRHVLAVAWNAVASSFYVVQMGRDQLDVVAPEYYDSLDNAERVAEVMHQLPEGANLGWPYTYWDPIKKARMQAPEFGGDGRKRAEAGKYPDPLVAFPAHWAPLQMAFYTGAQFPAKYRGGAFIAFHGSWNRAPHPQEGFNLSFAPFDAQGNATGTYEVFARSAVSTRFRMGGVAVAPDGSLYLSETDLGRIWRITYTGEESAAAKPAAGSLAPAAPSADVTLTPGAATYAMYCAVCHMPDGSGAGQMQPALRGSAVVAGDPQRLISVVLQGPAAVLPADRPRYSNIMPAFGMLTDQQIAELATFLRQNFGHRAAPVTAADVAAARPKS